MGNSAISLDLPSSWSAAWLVVSRQCEGLRQELSGPVLSPKPALGSAGNCARASSILLHAFMESLEKQNVCIRLRDSSFSCLSC